MSRSGYRFHIKNILRENTYCGKQNKRVNKQWLDPISGILHIKNNWRTGYICTRCFDRWLKGLEFQGIKIIILDPKLIK